MDQRRERRRRWLRAVLGAWLALVAVGFVLAVRWMEGGWRPASPLAADPAFGGAPVAVSGSDPEFAVYRVEATPAEVTVWWAVTGPSAGRGSFLAPVLTVREQTDRPGRHEAVARSRDQVLGKSTFDALVPNGHPVFVKLPAPSPYHGDRIVIARPSLRADPGERVIDLAAELLPSVRLGPGYVVVRAKTSLARDLNLLTADGHWLAPRAYWTETVPAPDEVDLIFDAPPLGSDRLFIQLPEGFRAVEASFDLPDENLFRDERQVGANREGHLYLPPLSHVHWMMAVDSQLRKYRVHSGEPEAVDGASRVALLIVDIPPDAVLTSFVIGELLRWHPAERIEIPLR